MTSEQDIIKLTEAVKNQDKVIARIETTLEKNTNKLTHSMDEVAKGLSKLTISIAERTIIDENFEKRIINLENVINKLQTLSALNDNFRQSFLKIGLPIVTMLLASAIVGGMMFKFTNS